MINGDSVLCVSVLACKGIESPVAETVKKKVLWPRKIRNSEYMITKE